MKAQRSTLSGRVALSRIHERLGAVILVWRSLNRRPGEVSLWHECQFQIPSRLWIEDICGVAGEPGEEESRKGESGE